MERIRHARNNVSASLSSHHFQSTPVQSTLVRFLAPGLLGDQPAFRTIVVPQSAQRFSGHHLSHVHADESDDEHAVAAQVVLRELGENARLAMRRVESAKLLSDVLDLPRPVQGTKEPLHHVDGADQCQKHVPEPQKYEDLFVKEVDRQFVTAGFRNYDRRRSRLIVSAH